MNDTQGVKLIRVWDLPVRLFHWLLVLMVIISIVTGKLGGNWLEWHQRSGIAILGLVSFRILWGFAGSHHARFKNFLRGPNAVLAYVKSVMKKDSHNDSNSPRHAGHNPLGALNVAAMLGGLLLQAVLGLFSNDDVMLEGPYARLVSKEVSDQLSALHQLNANLILILIALHLAAVAFKLIYRRENLVMAMITGNKMLPADTATPACPGWLAWMIGACVVIVIYVVLLR